MSQEEQFEFRFGRAFFVFTGATVFEAWGKLMHDNSERGYALHKYEPMISAWRGKTFLGLQTYAEWCEAVEGPVSV